MPDQETGAIVVVEDDDGMRRAFERVLSAAGFHAVTFASAETLLHCHAADSAACIVLDIHLPGLSGFELRRELVRTSSGHPPVIFITGHDDRSAREQAAALGAAPSPKRSRPGVRQRHPGSARQERHDSMNRRVEADLPSHQVPSVVSRRLSGLPVTEVASRNDEGADA
jgi:CheY-like chemotaxis protein